MPQVLNSKEASLFRQVVKNFESKQFKKGLKAAEQILRKYPNHGETEAMKALLLNSTGHQEEAFALAKVALTHDMKSHVCWHVYGLLWRAAKNFEEAIKAYKFALKLEPESTQIQRDLALLQVQMRDYQGYLQSRKNMVQARSTLRQNWTALAVAYHLAGDLAAAEKTLTTYEETIKTTPPKTDIEHSEASLYKNSIIAERGDTERALDHLESIMKNNLDKSTTMEMRAKYLLALERRADAEKAYRDLIARNPEYRAYYDGLEKSLSIERTNIAALKELYGSYAQKHDRIDAAFRVPLDFLTGDDFRNAADEYLRYMLSKGVPSTFNNIKALYGDEFKRNTVQELVEGYNTGSVPNGDDGKEDDHSERFRPAVLYFLAQHYNYKLSRDLKKALEFTEILIEMFPKRYDYQMTRARILKHQGNPLEAAKAMDEARNIDLKDRYINTKCAKYQLRNDDNESALQTMSKFTKNDNVGGTLGDLVEMQVLWFLTEDGEAYARRGMLGLALKRFHTVFDIFDLWQEDQFDFHSFSFRKGQIKAYVEMIRWEDRLREHPFYARAAMQAVKAYISLFDHPPNEMNGVNGVDESERKKAIKKAKKEQERLEREDAERREADRKAAAKKGNADGETKKPDPDPRGTKLLDTKEPLEDAMKFLSPLLEFGSTSSEAQHIGFEVFIRRKKYFLALKCLLTAFKIDKADPTNHEQTIRFLSAVNEASKTKPLDPLLIDLMSTDLPAPYSGIDIMKTTSSDLLNLASQIRPSNGMSISHVYASVLARQKLDPRSLQQNIDDLVDTLDSPSHPKLDLECAVNGASVMRQLFDNQHTDTGENNPSETHALRRYVTEALKVLPGAEVRLNRAAALIN